MTKQKWKSSFELQYTFRKCCPNRKYFAGKIVMELY